MNNKSPKIQAQIVKNVLLLQGSLTNKKSIMNWCHIWDYFYTAIISGMIAYAFQRWYSHKFDKRLKSFENEIETIKDKNVIKFDALHKNRIEVINKLYSDFCHEMDLVFFLIMPSNIKPKNALPDEDLIRKFYLHSRNFVLYLSQNSIYLPKIIVDRFAGAEYSLKSMVQSVIKDGSDENKKRLDAHYDQNLRQLFEELKNEIRDLLGVEESDFETLHIKK